MTHAPLPLRPRRGLRHALLCAILAPFIAASPVAAQPPAAEATTEANRQLVRDAFDAWANGESVFGELLAENVEWTIHGSDPVAGTYTNRADFVERASVPLISRLAGPLVPEVHAIYADGDTVIVRFDGSATTTSGAPYRNQFVWIFELADGEVVRAEAFLDLSAYRTVVDNNAPRG
ncbi:nuclear transport factor 2 family protein [Acuticoccus sp. M5D2P5]|uniref:nuclear transport factor 2 family protein n=1 Tax=Acuticoccus kalidii TaxID=2910977 RepID=UPI001F28E659|nr:nuclear transport factor 2 family protein [Acuticoccus kalidii]MCF3934945.1 nuclear transport factor 2 family protein [Acuticoccus kalidii]